MQPASASYLLQKVAPLVMRELSPYITNRLAPIVAQKVGIPIAKKIGLPIAKKIGIPLARKAGAILLHKVGYPLMNRVLLDVPSPNSGIAINNVKKADQITEQPKKKRRSLREMIRPAKVKNLAPQPLKAAPALPAPVTPFSIQANPQPQFNPNPHPVVPSQQILRQNLPVSQGQYPYLQHNQNLFRTRRGSNSFGYRQ